MILNLFCSTSASGVFDDIIVTHLLHCRVTINCSINSSINCSTCAKSRVRRGYDRPANGTPSPPYVQSTQENHRYVRMYVCTYVCMYHVLVVPLLQ